MTRARNLLALALPLALARSSLTEEESTPTWSRHETRRLYVGGVGGQQIHVEPDRYLHVQAYAEGGR